MTANPQRQQTRRRRHPSLPLLLALSALAPVQAAASDTNAVPVNTESLVLCDRGIERAEVVVDSRGRPHIVSDQGADGTVVYSYHSGTRWVSRTVPVPGDTPMLATEPHIVALAGEEAFVTFHWAPRSNRKRGRVALFAILRLPGLPELQGPLVVGQGRYPHVRLGPAGRVYILWRIGRDLFYRVRSPDGTLSGLFRLSNTRITMHDEEMGGCSANFDFEVGPEGTVHGACTNILGLFYTNSLMEARDQGVLFIAAGHKIGCEGPYTVPSMAADRSDPRILYVLFSGVDRRTYLVRRDPSGWRRPILAVQADSHQSGPRNPPFLAARPGGGAVMSWMDDRSGRYEIYVRTIAPNGDLGPEVRVAAGCNPRLYARTRQEVDLVYSRQGSLLYQRVRLPGR